LYFQNGQTEKTHSSGLHREFNRGGLVNKYMSESVNHKQVLKCWVTTAHQDTP